MNDSTTAIALGVQLLISAGLVIAMTIIHAIGVLAISRLLRLEDKRLKDHAVDFEAICLLGGLGLLVFALHIAEIVIFAGFFLWVDALSTLEEALYYSASAYATLGWTAEFFPRDWRLIGAIEALIGFILIGWSTAFMASKIHKLTN